MTPLDKHKERARKICREIYLPEDEYIVEQIAHAIATTEARVRRECAELMWHMRSYSIAEIREAILAEPEGVK